MNIYEKQNCDQFMMQIAMTAALYGLIDSVDQICAYTEKKANLYGASILARGIVRVSVKRYDEALAILDFIINEPELEKWHEDAYGFKALAYRFKGDHDLAKAALQKAAPQFAPVASI